MSMHLNGLLASLLITLFAQASARTAVNLPIMIEKLTKCDTLRDHLFFLPGQLCQHARVIYEDDKGRLWIGTNVYDLICYDGERLTYYDEDQGFSGGRVTGIGQDSQGCLWIATGKGLNLFNDGIFTTYGKDDGLRDEEIWAMLIDKQDILYLGHGSGLSSFDGHDFKDYSLPTKAHDENSVVYDAERVSALAMDDEGNIWIGTDGQGLLKYDGQKYTHFTLEDGLSDMAICDLMVDRKGGLWIGSFFAGVNYYDGRSMTNLTQKYDLKGVEVGGFFEDHNGDVYFGVENNGIYRYDGHTFYHHDKEALLMSSILCIHRDSQDRIWLGGWGGVFRFDGECFTSVTRSGPWH